METNSTQATTSPSVIFCATSFRESFLIQKIAQLAKGLFQMLQAALFWGISFCHSLQGRCMGPRKEQKEYWKEKLTQNGLELKNAPHWVKKNPQLVEIAILKHPDAVRYFDKSLCNQYDFLKSVLLKGEWEQVPWQLLEGEALWMLPRILKKKPNLIDAVSDEIRLENNLDMWLQIANPSHLNSIRPSLKDKKIFWLAFCRRISQSVWNQMLEDNCFSEFVYKKRWFWKGILASNISTLKYLSKIEGYLDILKIALDQDADSFKYASEELRNDPDAVLLALEKNVENFQYASSLRENKNFVLQILTQYPEVFPYIAKGLKKDLEIYELLIKS